MLHRRGVLAATITGALLASPALACRAPAPKDRAGYKRVIDRLFYAWWVRDFASFRTAFEHPERTEQFDAAGLFQAHFTQSRRRFRGELLFNGASVAAQVVTPQGADPLAGICGGYAVADLFLVKFFPGLETPVMEEVRHLDTNALASTEWRKLAQTG